MPILLSTLIITTALLATSPLAIQTGQQMKAAIKAEREANAMQIRPAPPLKIVLVGDSTVALGGGWGPGFCAALAPSVTCLDQALNGRSSKSFRDEGAWTKALAEHADYYLIQFGHNDQPGKGLERETDAKTTFPANLTRYVAEARAQHAIPILVTSLSRRTYKDGTLVQDLTAYAEATRRVAREQSVPLIDLNAISTNILLKMTQQQADTFNAINHEDAKAEAEAATAKPIAPDRTHLNPAAQQYFGHLVAEDLARNLAALRVDLTPSPSGKSDKPRPQSP